MCILFTGLSGCATAPPLPLVVAPTLAPCIGELEGGRDIHRPLEESQLLRLILLNNPALKASRTRRGLTRAQVVEAGIAPNPSVTGNIGYLVSGAGDATAWSAGFAQSLQALVTRGTRRDEAKATSAGVDATLLWEEWQTIARARKLYIEVLEGDEQLGLRQRSATVLAERAQALREAVARGDVDTGTASPIFVAAGEARAALDDADHTLRAHRADLAAMLGLDSRADVPLAPLPALPPLDVARATASIASMGSHRPDLAALRFGFAAQDSRLRGAILSQFPPLSLGINASQDNSRVRNAGPSVSFDLPLFDRGQGRIAVEDATRRQLHAEYTARLDEAVGEAQALLDAVIANERTLAQTPADPTGSVPAIEKALAIGDIDAGAYADLAVAEMSLATGRVTRDLYRREQRVALETLTGAGMPETLPAEGR